MWFATVMKTITVESYWLAGSLHSKMLNYETISMKLTESDIFCIWIKSPVHPVTCLLKLFTFFTKVQLVSDRQCKEESEDESQREEGFQKVLN